MGVAILRKLVIDPASKTSFTYNFSISCFLLLKLYSKYYFHLVLYNHQLRHQINWQGYRKYFRRVYH